MSMLDTAHESGGFALDPNRPDAAGLVLSTLVPLVLVMTASLAVGRHGLPGDNWISAIGFLPLFPMWGAARWIAWQQGEAGRHASHWVLALIGWGVLYPLASVTLDPFLMGWVNMLGLFLAAVATARLWPVSKGAMLLVLPTIVWLALAAIPAYLLVTGGWSPGFAVTVAAPDND